MQIRILSARLPDHINAFDHQIFDVGFQLQTAETEIQSGFIKTAFFGRQPAHSAFAVWSRSAGMYILNRSDDLIKESFFMLFFQQKIRKTGEVAFGITEAFHRQNIIPDPVEVHADQTVAVKKDAVVELHCSIAHSEQEGKRFPVIRCCRVWNVSDGDKTSLQTVFHFMPPNGFDSVFNPQERKTALLYSIFP